jgi:hypothetical protein
MLVPDPPTGFSQVRYGYWWRSGQVAGHQAIFTVRGTAANLRFPRDGVTVVVLGNDDQDDAGAVAADLAALVFGKHVAAPPPIQTHAPAALVGIYRRTFRDADRTAARDAGLKDWVGGTITIMIGTGSIHFALMDYKPEDSVDEYYTATENGRLTLGRYTPANHNSFCSDNPHSVPPTGTYSWARQGNALIITRTTFDPCLDRGATLPGTWTKIGWGHQLRIKRIDPRATR